MMTKLLARVSILALVYSEIAFGINHESTLSQLRRLNAQTESKRQNFLMNELSQVQEGVDLGFVHFLLGFGYFEKGDLREATKYLSKVTQSTNEDDPINTLSRLYLKLSNSKSISSQASIALAKKIFKEDTYRGFRHEAFKILFDALRESRKVQEFRTFFFQYLTRFPYGRRDPQILENAVSFFDHNKMPKERNRALEELSSLYPFHEEAFLAIGKYFRKNCDYGPKEDGKDDRFPPSILLRLSRHATPESGLRDFISRYALTFSHFNQSGELGGAGQFLLRARYPSEALTFALGNLNQLDGELSQDERARRGALLLILAQAHLRSGDYERAARAASVYLSEFESSTDATIARELLGDALALLRLHPAAADVYATVALSNRSLPVVKWHHFWNLALGKLTDRALDLLSRPGYVSPRDTEVPHGLEYWQARLLDRKGHSRDAEKIISRIRAEDGHGYYQFMLQLRKYEWNSKPAEVSKIMDDNGDPQDLAMDVYNGAEKFSDTKLDLKFAEMTLRRFRLMADLGLTDLAKKFSKGTSWIRIAKGGYAEACLQLAQNIGDYRLAEQLYKLYRRPPSTLKMLDEDKEVLFPMPYRETVLQAARTFSIDPYLIYSVMRAESHFDADALSSVGARGLLQIIPTTAMRISKLLGDSEFQVNELSNPGINIYYAAYYLRFLMDHYSGSIIPTIAAYNAGPGAVDQWIKTYGDLEVDEFIETISYKETRKYVKTVLRNFHHYSLVRESETGALKKIGPLPREVSKTEVF